MNFVEDFDEVLIPEALEHYLGLQENIYADMGGDSDEDDDDDDNEDEDEDNSKKDKKKKRKNTGESGGGKDK